MRVECFTRTPNPTSPPWVGSSATLPPPSMLSAKAAQDGVVFVPILNQSLPNLAHGSDL